MTITTRKIKCNGRIFKGTTYSVEVSDGKNEALFLSNGESKIAREQFGSATNEYASKFVHDASKPGALRQLMRSGKTTDRAAQKAQILVFIDKCIGLPVRFIDDIEGELTYTI